jgi:cytochrome c553
MKIPVWVLAIAIFLIPAVRAAAQDGQGKADPLPWAYGVTPPAPPATPPAQPDLSMKHVAGSTLSFTLPQVRDAYGPADWHPEDHGAMPDIVAHGKKPDVLACSLCHYPNGKGRAENAGVSGLPVEYFTKQMMDFKNGVRASAEPRKANTKRMAAFAKAMSDDEIKASAEYFASISWTPWIKVVESQTAPKTRIAGGLFLKLEGNETEPLGNRIIEVANDAEATETLRDDHSAFTAYAPIGSIKKGEALVSTGGAGKTVQCGICHGVDLKGLGPIPPLAGRSPSYIARQIYDIQHDARHGSWAPLMKKAVEKLSDEDIVSITAYLASLPVASAPSGALAPAAPLTSPAAVSTASGDSLVTQGKSLFQLYKCYDCHGDHGQGTNDGPDLMGTKLSGDEIAAFLKKPSADALTAGMPDFPGDNKDVKPLVAFVQSLKH